MGANEKVGQHAGAGTATPAVGAEYACRQEQRLPRELVSALADRALTVDPTGGIFARCLAEMCPNIARMTKAFRVVDCRCIGECRDGPYAWNSKQPCGFR